MFKTVRVKWYSKYWQTRESWTVLFNLGDKLRDLRDESSCKDPRMRGITTRGESAHSFLVLWRQSDCQTQGGQGIDDSCRTKQQQQYHFHFSLVTASSPVMFWLTHAKYWAQFGLGKLWLRSDEATERRTKKGLAPQDSGRDSVWNTRLGTRFYQG